MEPSTAVSFVENSDQKLVLQIDLSAWKLQQLCPQCHYPRLKTWRKDPPDRKVYDNYVELANAKFGGMSLPLCYGCWDSLQHYDKCGDCQAPLCLRFDDVLEFGNVPLSLTTVFQKDDVNGDFCVACCDKLNEE
jgi:hypothetical protein